MSLGAYAFEGVDASLLREVHTTFKGLLFGSLGQNPRWSQRKVQLAEDLNVTGSTAKVKMASVAYGVHEWLDERHKSKIEHADHEIEVKRWANAISLKLDDLDDESANLSQYRTLIKEMADDFDEHKHKLFVDLINNGFTGAIGVAYDGQFFFDTDHPIPGGTQSNKGTAAFDDGGVALYDAIKAMEALKKPNGLHANIMPTHGIFPSALRAKVEKVLKSDFFVDGNGTKSNLMKNRIEPIFDPRLDAVSETAWYLLDADKMRKPFFQAKRKEVTPQMDMSDAFEKGVAHWGSYGRYNASYGFYQVMWGSTGAG